MKQHWTGSKWLRLVSCTALALAAIVVSSPLARGEPTRSAPAEPVASASEIDYPPFCIVDQTGRVSGFSVELMEAALAAMGRKVTFRPGPWSEVRGWLERGEVKALPLVGRTPEREALFDFTFPYMSLYGAIVVRTDTTGIQALNDLRGRSVAVMKGDNAEEFLRREERGLRIHTTATFQEALRELSEGRHDAVVVQRLVGLRLIQETGLKNLRVLNRPIEGFRQDFCFAVQEGDRDTLALLNEGLALVMADGTYRHLHARWFAAMELPSNRRIVVGGDHKYPPYEYLDESGRPAGFNVELTRAIAREMDLSIEIRLGPWSQILEDLERGEIDVVQGMFYSPDRDLKFDFSPPHGANQYIGVVRRGEGPPPSTVSDLAGRRIAVQRGDVVLELLAREGVDKDLILAESQEEVLQALAEKRADCAVAVRLSTLGLIEKHGWTNLRAGAKPLVSVEYCYAVPNGHKALLATFSEGLEILDKSGEYRRIHQKWLGSYETAALSFAQIVRTVAIWVGPLLAILLALFAWSWTLRRQVALKTEELRQSAERFREVFESANVGKSITLPTGEIHVNQAYADVLGYTREELQGKTWQELTPVEDLEPTQRRIELLLKGELDATRFEKRYLRKDGGCVWADLSTTLRRDAEGNPLYFVTTVVDISARKQAEAALRESEAFQRAMIACTPLALYSIDPSGTVLSWNPSAERIFGWTADEVLGRPLPIVPRDKQAEFDELRRQVARGGGFVGRELMRTRKDGVLIPVSLSVAPIRDAAGKTIGIMGAAEDISERKKAEETLRYQALLLSDMGGIAKIGGWEFDPGTGRGSWTEEVARIHDLDPGEPTDVQKGLSFYRGEHRSKIEQAIREAVETGAPYDLELELITARGGRKWVRTICRPRIENGKVVQMRGSFQDITDRKHSELRIEHLNQVLRAIRGVNQLIIRERSPDQLIREACRLLVQNRGYPSALIVLTDARSRPTAWAMSGLAEGSTELERLFEEGRLLSCFEHAMKMGGVILVEDRRSVCAGCPNADDCAASQSLCSPLTHEEETFGYLAAAAEHSLVLDEEERSLFGEMARDIAYALRFIQTEDQRRRGEEALRESESRFRLLADLAPVGIVVSDSRDRVIYVSPKFSSLFGYTLEDMPTLDAWWRLAYPDEGFRTHVRRDWEAGVAEARRTSSEVGPREYPVQGKDGTVRQIEFRMAATGQLSFVVVVDVTDRRRAEEEREKLQNQLLQAQKMEAVGRLAGGVAHDFNNMLGVILGYAQLAMDRVELDDGLFQDLSEIMTAARRSADITRQLLAFARKQTVAPRVLDLNETVEGMLKMLRRLIGEDIDLQWLPATGLWPVKLDPSQVDQMLANLCVNARDAIDGVGKITIETENADLDKAYCDDHPGFVEGRFVMLAVSDDGCGMDRSTLSNLFEPFFTTKGVGQGTGLGLATVYGIVKQNDGFINVYSEPGKGTTFKIYLPRHAEQLEELSAAREEQIAPGHGEAILVVEDETSVLMLACRILEGLGYTVLTAATPREAELLAQSFTSRLDLLITDVVMPMMNGRELAARVHAHHPEVRTLFMSGYTANVIAHHGVLDEGVHFIQKPFSRHQLAAKVREVLESQG